MPSTLTFTLLIAVVLFAMLVVLASTFTFVASIRLLLSTIACALTAMFLVLFSTLTFVSLMRLLLSTIACAFTAMFLVLFVMLVVLFSTLPLILVI